MDGTHHGLLFAWICDILDGLYRTILTARDFLNLVLSRFDLAWKFRPLVAELLGERLFVRLIH